MTRYLLRLWPAAVLIVLLKSGASAAPAAIEEDGRQRPDSGANYLHPEACGLDEFVNAIGECISCSWCYNIERSGSPSQIAQRILHRDSICRRLARSCSHPERGSTSAASPKASTSTQTSSDAKSTRVPEKLHEALDKVTSALTVEVESSTDGIHTASSASVPVWAWCVGAVSILVLIMAAIAGFTARLVRRKRAAKSISKTEEDEDAHMMASASVISVDAACKAMKVRDRAH